MNSEKATQGGQQNSEVEQLRLTDEGLEMPDYLVGRTGKVKIEMPEITMTPTYVGDGVQKFDQAVVFPPTDKEPRNVPEGHLRIDGTLYEIVDDREANECPECGSDKISVYDDPVMCYDCSDERGGVEVDISENNHKADGENDG